MRVRFIATSCLLIAVSAGSVTTLAANPDCSRWIREYQDALAKRSVHAKRHVVRAAHRIVIPRPKFLRANVPARKKYTPKLTPAEMLRRFKILCGEDLPDDALPAEFLPSNLQTELVPSPIPEATPFPDTGIAPVTFTPSAPVAAPQLVAAAPEGNLLPTTPFTPLIPAIPAIPVTGSSTGTAPNNGTDTNGTGTTGTGTTTTGSTPSPVPEPDTLVLLLTGGSLGIVPALIRRRKRMRPL